MRQLNHCSRRFVIVFGVTLVIAANALAQPQSQIPNTVNAQNVEVLWAVWGRDTRRVDATTQVAQLLATKGRIFAGVDELNAGNPAPNRNKTLQLLLSIDGVKLRFDLFMRSSIDFQLNASQLKPGGTAPELTPQELARLQTAIESGQGVQLIWARYGDLDSKAIDVTDAMIGVMNNQKIVNDRATLDAPDLQKGHSEDLVFLLAVNQQLIRIHLNDWGVFYPVPDEAALSKTPVTIESDDAEANGDASDADPADHDADTVILDRLTMATTIPQMQLSSDGEFIYALDSAAGKVLKISTTPLEVVAESAPLPKGVTAMALSHRYGAIYVAAAPNGFDSNRDQEEGQIARLRMSDLTPLGRLLDITLDPCGIAVDREGRLYVASGSNQHTSLAQIDGVTGRIVSTTRVRQRSILHFNPQTNTLYWANTDVSPASIYSLILEPRTKIEDIKPFQRWDSDEGPIGGDFTITDNGRAIINRRGAVLRLARSATNDMTPIGIIGLNTGAAIAPVARALLMCSPEKMLDVLEYPSLRPASRTKLQGVLTSLCIDERRGRVYALWCKSVDMDGRGRFRSTPLGDLVSIDLGAVVPWRESVLDDPELHVDHDQPEPAVEAMASAPALPVAPEASPVIIAGDKPLQHTQTSVKGLVVQDTAAGLSGMVVDLIATVRPISGVPGSTSLIGRDIGDEMRISFDEAVRTVEFRYPNWTGGEIVVSFGDKYTAKDGGSAGAAFSLLLVSVIEGFEIDPAFAITGDITVDGKVGKIGGLNAKVRGAILDKATIVGIPADNVEHVGDILLLQGENALWDAQIISLAGIDDATAVARMDRDEKIAEAIALFESLRDDHVAHRGGSLAHPQTLEKLERVVELMPDHQSAQILLQHARREAPRQLTLESTLQEMAVLLNPIQPELLVQRVRLGTLNRKEAGELRRRAGQLRQTSAPEARQLINTVSEYVGLVAQVYTSGEIDTRMRNKLNDALRDFYTQLEALGSNREALEKLLR